MFSLKITRVTSHFCSCVLGSVCGQFSSLHLLKKKKNAACNSNSFCSWINSGSIHCNRSRVGFGLELDTAFSLRPLVLVHTWLLFSPAKTKTTPRKGNIPKHPKTASRSMMISFQIYLRIYLRKKNWFAISPSRSTGKVHDCKHLFPSFVGRTFGGKTGTEGSVSKFSMQLQFASQQEKALKIEPEHWIWEPEFLL